MTTKVYGRLKGEPDNPHSVCFSGGGRRPTFLYYYASTYSRWTLPFGRGVRKPLGLALGAIWSKPAACADQKNNSSLLGSASGSICNLLTT